MALVAFTMLLILTVSRVTPLTAGINSNNSSAQVLHTDSGKSISETETKTLYLLVLLPYPDLKGGLQPSWSGGPNVLPAIEMAVEDINRRPGILDGYTLDLIKGDGGCNIIEKTFTGLVENMFHNKDKQPVGIIGPGCSTSTLHTAPITGRDEVALISAHGASTQKLEDRDKYPYMFGGFSSFKTYAKALAGFIKKRQWTKIAILYDTSRIFHKTAFAEISSALSEHTETEINFSSGIYSSFLPVEQLKERFLKVTVLLAGPKLVREILCLSYHRGLSFPTHQFLIIERHLLELTREDVHVEYAEKTYFCSKKTMLNEVLEGNLLSEYRISPDDWNSSSTVNGTSYNEFMTHYERKIKLRQKDKGYAYRNSTTKSIWSVVWYDLVWAMALALNNAKLYDGIDLQTYGLGMKHVTSKIYNQFQELDFEGMSGRISFEQNSSSVQRNVDLFQITRGKTKTNLVAVVNGSHVVEDNNGKYTSSEYPTRLQHMQAAATVVVLFLTSVTILALVVTHVLTVKYRCNQVVKGSSPRLQHLAYMGCYLLTVATVTLMVPEAFTVDDIVYIVFCHIMSTCFSCGYTLIIATVCAKTWRLYRIFCHFQKPGKMLADRFLFVAVIALTLVDVVVNIAWASVDHFTINSTETFENNSNGDIEIVTISFCTSHYRVAWNSAIIGYNVCLLFVAVYLAILTRKVHVPQFQTKTVVILAYILFLLFGLSTPLKFILDNQFVWIAMFLLTVQLCILLLFLPPLLTAITNKRRVHTHTPRPSIITLFGNIP